MLLQELLRRLRKDNTTRQLDDGSVVDVELELSTPQLLLSPDGAQSFYDCMRDGATCKFGSILWHLEWHYWCSDEVFLSLMETVVEALVACQGVKRLLLFNVEDAFPVHNDRLHLNTNELAQIPSESLEMHGVAFGPNSAALDGLCHGLLAQKNLQKVVWSPFAANPTQGVTQVASSIIHSHFSGAFVMETRMDPTTWQAVLQLLEDSQLGALHVRADNHSSTPPDPLALAAGMTTNTSLQSLFLHGMAMKWLCAATFPVDLPALLQRNQWLAKVRRWSPVVVEPGTFGQAVVCLVEHGTVALSALFVLLQNHYWTVTDIWR